MRSFAMRALLVSLTAGTLLCDPVNLGAQATILDRNIRVARSLSAIVTTFDGDPMPGIIVEELGENWNEILRTTKTDETGTFTFAPMKGRKIYYFRVSALGFKSLEFRMKIDNKHGKPLTLQMELAN
jgi:hypothetical protein